MSTKKLIKFPSIDQYRTIVTNVNRHSTFTGLDENGDAIYDNSKPKPTLVFKGTVKLHGTNGSVAYNEVDGMWAQSRENIITSKNDNAGFAWFTETKEKVFLELFNQVKEIENLDLTKNTIVIYGEWVGSGIQKGVAISNIPKSFFIFGVKVRPHTDEPESETKTPSYWVLSEYLSSPKDNIFNIDDYETYELAIDFSKPELFQNTLVSITEKVEEECPVSKTFGHSGIGEGVVWTCNHEGNSYRFKVKGEKHSAKSKVKTLKPVDDVKVQKCIDLAEKVTPSWRLDQGLTETFNLINGGGIERSGLGNYLKWVMNDIIKEESDTISEAGLEPKDIGKYVSEIARSFFFEQEKL